MDTPFAEVHQRWHCTGAAVVSELLGPLLRKGRSPRHRLQHMPAERVLQKSCCVERPGRPVRKQALVVGIGPVPVACRGFHQASKGSIPTRRDGKSQPNLAGVRCTHVSRLSPPVSAEANGGMGHPATRDRVRMQRANEARSLSLQPWCVVSGQSRGLTGGRPAPQSRVRDRACHLRDILAAFKP